MANTKISALTSATTPLAGTEVLPIVQSGVTVKVANNDLRPKQIQSNATSGVLQVTGPAAASTRVATVPDANFTVARTDAAQSFTGNQTLSTGNLVIGTSGNGIDFSATPGTGTSELFDDYEEGAWTPTLTSASGVCTVGTNVGRYTKIGRMVYIDFRLQFSTNASVGTSTLTIGGLPFTAVEPSIANLVLSNWSGGDYGTGGANGLAAIDTGTTITYQNRTIDISSRTSFYWWFAGYYEAT